LADNKSRLTLRSNLIHQDPLTLKFLSSPKL